MRFISIDRNISKQTLKVFGVKIFSIYKTGFKRTLEVFGIEIFSIYRYKYAVQQLAYLKTIVDITTLKSATGTLREHQLKLLKFVNEFFEEIKELNIKPFLCAGNLIGAIRHKGFIPWDDDFDFLLVRGEYERLIDFCKKNYKCILWNINWENKGWKKARRQESKLLDKILKAYPNQYILCIHHSLIKVIKGNPIDGYNCIDFFVIDSFANDYSFQDHKIYLNSIKKKMDKINDVQVIISLLEEEKSNFKYFNNNSGNLYYGMDNMGAYIYPSHNKWIERDIVFPLRKMQYEDTEFWAPHKPEEFIKYSFPRYMDFPDDLGLPGHINVWK
jgi:lipopolysaccharide cholinephosphotransferase